MNLKSTGLQERTKILIVDDKMANLRALHRVLGGLDVDIDEANSGNEALKMLLDGKYALVLLDVQMPNMDGFEVAALMRENEATKSIPIIFVTAISKTDDHVFKGYDVGAVDYLFKPINDQVLLGKVKVFVTLHQQQLALHNYHAYLEDQVKLRTQELAKANKELAEAHANLKQSSEALVRSEKTTSMGILSAGVAHELNNPVMSVLNAILFAVKNVPKENQAFEPLQQGLKDIRKVSNLIKELLMFSNPDVSKKQNTNPEEIVSAVLKMLDTKLKANKIQVKTDFKTKKDLLPLPANGIIQVLTNLVTNSISAVKGESSPEINITTHELEGALYFHVKDNGVGVKDGDHRNIYSPFFTTLPPGEGPGLGLSLSSQIATSMDGELYHDEKREKGAEFVLKVPVSV